MTSLCAIRCGCTLSLLRRVGLCACVGCAAQDKDGRTALHAGAEVGHTEALPPLLEAKWDPTALVCMGGYALCAFRCFPRLSLFLSLLLTLRISVLY